MREADLENVREIVSAQGIASPYIVINPAGGRNPGMTMDIKRWPQQQFAELARRLAIRYNAHVVVIGGPQDTELVEAVQALLLPMPSASFPGVFTFPQLGALAREALAYVGNDTGITHYAAAAGAKTVMILGPSDPVRYAPFTPDSLALWKPASLPSGGVVSGAPQDWDWARDGISVDEAELKIIQFLNAKTLRR
jgi:ADP-heptose:LPS heptosyltransferase